MSLTPTPPRSHFLARFRSYRFLSLLLSLLVLLIASAFVGKDYFDRALLAALLTGVLFAAVGAVSPHRHVRWTMALMAATSAVVIFASLMVAHRAVSVPMLALFTIYLVYTIAVVMRRMILSTEIDADILCGAAAIYLLIGVAWAFTYWIIYLLDGNAFTATAALKLPPYEWHQFLYYSFSTLTTLGMGDISPVNRFAQIWTTLETATGNLYIALLVARLVSLYR